MDRKRNKASKHNIIHVCRQVKRYMRDMYLVGHYEVIGNAHITKIKLEGMLK